MSESTLTMNDVMHVIDSARVSEVLYGSIYYIIDFIKVEFSNLKKYYDVNTNFTINKNAYISKTKSNLRKNK